MSSLLGMSVCRLCFSCFRVQPGSFSNVTGVASGCQACPAGTSQSQAGASSCLFCTPGRFNPSHSAATCQVSPISFYHLLIYKRSHASLRTTSQLSAPLVAFSALQANTKTTLASRAACHVLQVLPQRQRARCSVLDAWLRRTLPTAVQGLPICARV